MSVALRIQYLKARYHVMNGHERFHLSFLQRADMYIIIIYNVNQWKKYSNNFQASSGTGVI